MKRELYYEGMHHGMRITVSKSEIEGMAKEEVDDLIRGRIRIACKMKEGAL